MSAVVRGAVALCATIAMLVISPAVPADAASKPAAPTGLAVRAGTSTAVVTWTAAKYATHYRVCLLTSKTQTSCGTVSPSVTEPTYRFTGLTPRAGTDYYVRVYAYNAAGRTGSGLKGFNLVPPVTPDVPTGIKQVVTSSAVTITWSAAAHARDYSVCLTGASVSTRCIKTSPRSATLTARFTGLTPTGGGDYFYRVQAFNRTVSSVSAQHRVDLPVGSIAAATATNGGAGRFKASWGSATNAETYELQVAANAAMTSRLKSFVVTGRSATPTLAIGTTYYYRVRGLNGVMKGAFTRVASLRLPSTAATIKVMTYNLCGQDKCVTRANGMKKWSSTRKDIAGRIVRGSDADIIATQESHDEDTRFGTELPGFALAAYYSAKSLFYDREKYDVLRSGHITLSSTYKKYAVWAEFRDETSRNTFIVVDAHLQPYKGKTKDDLRAAQTKTLLSKIASINTGRLPVVYAGDFNSNKSNADQSRFPGGYDAPRKVFLAAGIPDTYSGAARRVHPEYNSANQAINPPLKHYDHVDHVYADPKITVSSWKVLITVDHSRYVTPFATDHNPVRTILTVPGR